MNKTLQSFLRNRIINKTTKVLTEAEKRMKKKKEMFRSFPLFNSFAVHECLVLKITLKVKLSKISQKYNARKSKTQIVKARKQKNFKKSSIWYQKIKDETKKKCKMIFIINYKLV